MITRVRRYNMMGHPRRCKVRGGTDGLSAEGSVAFCRLWRGRFSLLVSCSFQPGCFSRALCDMLSFVDVTWTVDCRRSQVGPMDHLTWRKTDETRRDSPTLRFTSSPC